MKTPVQELFELLWETPKDKFEWYAIREQMLEKEKETIVDFTYKYGDETLAKISKIYDINFNTNEK
jgi:hypothetical protein